MANGAVRILKIVFYIAIIGSSGGMLYGFMKASSSIDQCLFGGGTCVLFGGMGNLTEHTPHHNGCTFGKEVHQALNQFKVPLSGKEDVCKFCLASAALQIAICFFGVLLVYYRHSTDKPGRSACSIVELIVAVVLTCLALLTAALVTAGLEMFCKDLLSGWADSYMHMARKGDSKPGECASATLFTFGGSSTTHTPTNVEFYHGMKIARTCSFIVAGVWLLHLLVSSLSAHSYRKNGATPVEEIQNERERRRANKAKKAQKKLEKELKGKDKKGTQKKSRSGKSGRKSNAWDEGTEMV